MSFATIAAEAISERGSQQRHEELTPVLEMVAARRPARVVEIGVHDAGTLWAWGQITPAEPLSQVFGVDVTDVNIRTRNFGDLHPRETDLFRGDSGDPEHVERVAKRLAGPIDFLFIDGDHHREAVVRDYRAWLPLMAKGGIIGFHDITVASLDGWNDVVAMQTDATVIEVRKRDSSILRMGIGLIVLP